VTLTGLAARNVLRNKFRVLLTILGVAIAVLTFVTLRTVLDAWSNTEAAVKDRIVTRHKITFVMTLPHRYAQDVASARSPSGEKLTRVSTFSNWFGAKDPKHDHEFFATLAIDSATYFEVYDEVQVPKEQLDAFMKDRSGAIVGDQLASKLHWSRRHGHARERHLPNEGRPTVDLQDRRHLHDGGTLDRPPDVPLSLGQLE